MYLHTKSRRSSVVNCQPQFIFQAYLRAGSNCIEFYKTDWPQRKWSDDKILRTMITVCKVFVFICIIDRQESDVGIATPYGLDSPGIESR
jgi:hypothetical protein